MASLMSVTQLRWFVDGQCCLLHTSTPAAKYTLFFFGKLPAVTLVKNSSPWPTWKHLSSDTTGRYPQVPMVWPLPHSGFPAKLSPLRHGCLYPFSGPSPSRSKSHCRSPLVWIFEEDKLVMYAFACIGCQVPAVSKTNKNSMKNSG